MPKLPEDVDPRVAYVVMLNGKEESPLHEALTELMQRGFMPERETLAATQRALRFLVSGGWLAVTRQVQGHAEAISFQLGRAYLVFASTDRVSGAGVEASKCLPNKPYAKAASELALIGPPIAKP